MGVRRRSIRKRIFLLSLIPLLSLVGLYVFVASITVGDAARAARTPTLKNQSGAPVLYYLSGLDAERRLAAIYLAAPVPGVLTQFQQQQPKTDQLRAIMEAGLKTSATRSYASAEEKQAIAAVLKDTGSLRRIRSEVSGRTINRLQAMRDYNVLAEHIHTLVARLVQELTPSVQIDASALVEAVGAQEALQQEDAVFESAAAARSFPVDQRVQFARLAAVRRELSDDALNTLGSKIRPAYNKYLPVAATSALAQLEDAIATTPWPGGQPPVDPETWGKTFAGVVQGLGAVAQTGADHVDSVSRASAHSAYLRLILAGGLGLLALLVSVFISFRVGRSIVRQLAELRSSALELADQRLPRVMARLRAGEEVDVAAEAPPMQTSSDEIGQVGQAFNVVQTTAVQAAVEQARLRKGVSDVFRNLARRSQSLLHRQLSLLDAMERRTSDPDELADLYRVDHLTTRMRRHAEGLIILSGAPTGRAWRKPVRLVDVLRAAVAEVEDYTRVNVVTRSQASLTGLAVADVIHLIAELVENATLFSPPNTPVRLTGDVVGNGFAVEIEDRGLGLSEPTLAEVNHRLANPPEFDLSDSDQLGLFVAGTLAARHRIRISMRANAYGGSTVIVLLPRELVVQEEDTPDRPAPPPIENPVLPTDRSPLAGEEIIVPAPLTELAADVSASNGSGAAAPDTDAVVAGSGSAQPTPVGARPGDDSVTGADPRDVAETPAAQPVAMAAQPPVPVDVGMDWGPSTAQQRGLEDNGWSLASSDAFTPAESVGVTEQSLPRRIRQAHVAPQLRDGGVGGGGAGGGDDEPSALRSPEQARALMTAMQGGWERGRSEAPTPDADDPGGDSGEQRGR